MKGHVSRLIAAAVFSFAAVFSYAAEDQSGECALMRVQKNCDKSIPMSKVKKEVSSQACPAGTLCSNARGCKSTEAGGYITTDFLYWCTDCQGFSYASNVVGQTGARPIVEIERISSEWSPGFRLGAGWTTDWDSWDVMVNWTWFRNTAKNSISNPSVSSTSNLLGLFPQWPAGSINAVPDLGPFQTAKASYAVLLNVFDLEVARSYYLTKTVAFSPFWGLRGEIFHQDLSSHFSGTFVSGNPTSMSFSGKNHNWGLGPRVGFSSNWDVGMGFSLFGRASGSLLYGATRASSNSNTKSTASSPWTPFIHTSDSLAQSVPTLQLQLGFNWMRCFDEDLKYYAINASWETNYWWNQFNLPVAAEQPGGDFYVYPTTNSQAVTFEGLTLNMIFGF